jgi:hypothetical protein
MNIGYTTDQNDWRSFTNCENMTSATRGGAAGCFAV